MDRFVIEGGRPLRGKVHIEGVKNAVLPMMCAALMAEKGKTILHNVPYLHDIRVLEKLIDGFRQGADAPQARYYHSASIH